LYVQNLDPTWLSLVFVTRSKFNTFQLVFILWKPLCLLLWYYISQGSCMYVAFLDATKALDRVNHTKLVVKLLKLGQALVISFLSLFIFTYINFSFKHFHCFLST
jgi:hypothetical protein